MRVFLDPDILKWLVNVLALDASAYAYSLNSTGKCEVRDENLIQDISLGLVLADVLKTLKTLNSGLMGPILGTGATGVGGAGAATKDTSTKLELLKKVKTAGAKAYNWNILFEQLQTLLDLKIDKGRRGSLLRDSGSDIRRRQSDGDRPARASLHQRQA